MSFDLKTYLAERRVSVEEMLQNLAQKQTFSHSLPGQTPTRLAEAMRYSLLAGGKRLRPILAMAGCEAVGGKPETALPFGCAVEMIHTYSLIHDDLPAMDNDDFRRGRPTNHKVFGDGLAILAGDALLTDAFGLVVQSAVSADVVIELVRELAFAAGSPGMVGGQVLDVEATGKRVDLAHLQTLHSMKTGALFDVSLRGGARLGGANHEQLASIRTYAQALGLAFQIVDDVLDVTQDLAQLGKDPGSDREAGKTTYVDLLGVEGAMARARQVMADGIAALAPLGEQADPLRRLGQYTVERQS
ncbi:MAG TPA: polyprenyl synthetase family protein [Pseudomonadota bacterium]|nr:polyprenyl synthetase family protein [Pseudomonadota bacterium]